MVYNKLKRNLELAAGIVGVSVSAITGVFALALFASNIAGVAVFEIAYGLLPFILVSVAISICSIIFCAMIIKSPVRAEGVLKTTNTRICVIIFAVLTSNLITLGLEIAVLCLKDFKNTDTEVKTNNKYIQPPVQQSTKENQTQNTNIETKIAELKNLKELGIIDEQTYNKAIAKLIETI